MFTPNSIQCGTENYEKCCVCDRQAVEEYQDREDCPWCGDIKCGLKIQLGLDFMAEKGNG